MTSRTKAHTPSRAQYNAVKAAFIAEGRTLSEWCEEKGYHLPNVRKAFNGSWTGPRASQLVEEIEDAVRELRQ